MTKPETTPSAQTGTKPTKVEPVKIIEQFRTVNGAFTMRGEESAEIGARFMDWCEDISKEFGLTVMSSRVDYNGYWPTNRLISKEDIDKNGKT